MNDFLINPPEDLGLEITCHLIIETPLIDVTPTTFICYQFDAYLSSDSESEKFALNKMIVCCLKILLEGSQDIKNDIISCCDFAKGCNSQADYRSLQEYINSRLLELEEISE